MGNATPLGESWGESFSALPTFTRLSSSIVIISNEGKAQMVDKMINISTSTLSLYRVTDQEKNRHIYIYIPMDTGRKR